VFSLLLLTADPSHKIGFGIKLALVCSEPWVECPSHLDLMNIVRMFTVQIDPTGLPDGVHTSR
jgi:tripeptidyl-peptidase-2